MLSCRAQAAPPDAACRLPCLPVCDNQAKRVLPARGKLDTTPCLLADKVQSIDRAAHTAPPPQHHSPPRIPPPPPCPLSRPLPLLPARIHRPPPPPVLTVRRSGSQPFVCPPSIHPSNSGLPTQAHRAGAITLAARHPPTRKLVVSAGIKPSLQQHAPPPTGGTLEAERERTSSTVDAPCFTSPLSHLHPSLHRCTTPPPILSASPSAVASASSRLRCHLLTSPVLLRSVPSESFPRFGNK